MKKIILLIVLIFIVLAVITMILASRYALTKENIIALVSCYTILFSISVVYLQLVVNLEYNKRKSAVDFTFDKIGNELYPNIDRLKQLVHKEDKLTFPKNSDFLSYTQDAQIIEGQQQETLDLVRNILNFFERMASSIFKKVYEEDICFDDIGYNLVQFFNYTKSYITYLQSRYHRRIFINFQELAKRWEDRFLTQEASLDTSSIPKKNI